MVGLHIFLLFLFKTFNGFQFPYNRVKTYNMKKCNSKISVSVETFHSSLQFT